MKNPELMVADARNAFNNGITKSYDFRIKQMKALLRLLEENEDKLCAALTEDLRKPKFEAIVFEIEFVKNAIRNTLHNLKEWMEPVKPKKPLPFMFDKVRPGLKNRRYSYSKLCVLFAQYQ